MRILVTNDDGINAPALAVLASRLARAGHEVMVAAPLDVHSGCGASIGRVTEEELVSVARVSLPGAEDLEAVSVDAPPAFIAMAAIQGFFGPPPQVVVSGPNSGLNLGPLVLHSGTLGAAITAASNGVPGIALSTEKRARFGFEAAAEFCAANLACLLSLTTGGRALNINVPDLPPSAMAGVRMTGLSPRSLVGIVLAEAELPSSAPEQRRVRVTLDYDVDGLMHRRWRLQQGQEDLTDAGAIIDGCISVTAVHAGLRQADTALTPQGWDLGRVQDGQ